MSVHDDLCPHCATTVPAGQELESRCECGCPGVAHAGDGCALCTCPLFEWDGMLSCPDCLGDLEALPAPSRTHRAA